MLLTLRRLGPRSELASSTVLRAHLHVLRGFPFLHGSGTGYPGIVVLICSWFCGIGILSGDGICSRNWDAETSARWARASLLHRQMKCVGSCRTLRWTQRWQDSRKLWERWDSRCRIRAQRTWKSESQSRTHLEKTLTIRISFNGCAGSLDHAYHALL